MLVKNLPQEGNKQMASLSDNSTQSIQNQRRVIEQAANGSKTCAASVEKRENFRKLKAAYKLAGQKKNDKIACDMGEYAYVSTDEILHPYEFTRCVAINISYSDGEASGNPI